MNTDIRISVDFPTHRKTLKLIRRLGDGAPWILVRLWIYVARYLPDGVLVDMDAEDIEAAAGWKGDDGEFVRTLLDVGYLDRDDENGTICCHDWLEHNPWAAESHDRSDASRFSKMSQVNRAMFEDLQAAGVRGLSKRDYEICKRAAKDGKRFADISNSLAIVGDAVANASDSIAPAPSPVPSPSPSPLPEPEEEKQSQPASTEEMPTPPPLPPESERAGETPNQLAIRMAVEAKAAFIREHWPDVDVVLETERMVAKALKEPVLDPVQFVLAWFPRAKPTRAVMSSEQVEEHNRRVEAEFLGQGVASG